MDAGLKLHPLLAEMVGKTLAGRYQIVGILGHGGMSAVFAGKHLALGTSLAIKALHPQISMNSEIAARFDREARVASMLEHPNCCRVTDFGSTTNGLRFMVMPMLQGTDLRTQLGRAMPVPLALNYAMQVARGLRHAHAHGVVHRDLKPENLIVLRDHEGRPVVKITDFGITKILRGEGSDDALTSIGMIPGTPEYMSPEHAKGEAIDGRSDLYALGLIFYEMLVGQPAFWHENPRELMRMQVLTPAPKLPTELMAAPALQAVLDRLLAKDPNDRFFDALGVLQELEMLTSSLSQPTAAPEPIAPTLWQRIGRLFGKRPHPPGKLDSLALHS